MQPLCSGSPNVSFDLLCLNPLLPAPLRVSRQVSPLLGLVSIVVARMGEGEALITMKSVCHACILCFLCHCLYLTLPLVTGVGVELVALGFAGRSFIA